MSVYPTKEKKAVCIQVRDATMYRYIVYRIVLSLLQSQTVSIYCIL